MPSNAARSIDVVLTWSRTETGTTAVLQQTDDGGWDELDRTDATEFTVSSLTAGRTYVFAAAAVLADGGLAAEDEWETLRVTPLADEATPALPSAPAGFAAAQDGPNVNLRWDAATDGVTVAYELRVGDSWEDGVLAADALTGTATSWAWSSSGATTFHLKAVDRFGRVSADAASATLTIEALGDHVTADQSDQAAAGWPGPKAHLEVVGGALRLELLPAHFGAATSPLGSFAGVPCFAKSWPKGVYETPPFDAGQVERQRIEVALASAQPFVAPPPFGAVRRPALGAWAAEQTIDVEPKAPVAIDVEIDTSPTPGGAWDGWRPYAPGTCRYWRSRLRVTVEGDGLRAVRVPALVVVRRKRNVKQEGHVVVNCSPVDVVFPVPFQNPPKVTATILGYAGTPLVTNITPTGFTIAGGAAVIVGDPGTFAPTVHWQAMGT
jgi:hypothetical protein